MEEKLNEEKMVTYEDIRKANDTIKTTDIKGKNYAEVNQRIKAFRMVYPRGSILTQMISNENGICVFRVEIYDENKNILATGTAYEKENSTFINKTSYIENCETSAIGRALGIAGFGIDTSIASAEEVENAMANQPIDATKEKALRVLIKRVGLTDEKVIEILNRYGYKKLNEIALSNYMNIVKEFEKGE